MTQMDADMEKQTCSSAWFQGSYAQRPFNRIRIGPQITQIDADMESADNAARFVSV